MKTLEFIYQETEIHFLINPKDDNVMVNATEMAKLFNKRIDFFLKSDHAKAFIKILLSTPYGGNKTILTMDEIIQSNKKAGTFMNRILALKFAAWLSPKFEVWVFSKIEEITFGNLKKYRDAMAEEVRLKNLSVSLKQNLIDSPNKDTVSAYFDNETTLKSLSRLKLQATRNQLTLFKEIYTEQ